MEKKKREAENMPIGLMMKLAMHQQAMRQFSQLDNDQQRAVIRYVEDSKTGDDAKSRIDSAVQNLEQGNHSFFG